MLLSPAALQENARLRQDLQTFQSKLDELNKTVDGMLRGWNIDKGLFYSILDSTEKRLSRRIHSKGNEIKGDMIKEVSDYRFFFKYTIYSHQK